MISEKCCNLLISCPRICEIIAQHSKGDIERSSTIDHFKKNIEMKSRKEMTRVQNPSLEVKGRSAEGIPKWNKTLASRIVRSSRGQRVMDPPRID